MSIKSTAFAHINPVPKTLAHFAVAIPGILTAPLIVQAASLPQSAINVTTLNCTGVPVHLPTTRSFSGSWSFSVTENAALSNIAAIDRLRSISTPTFLTSSIVSESSPFAFIAPNIFVLDELGLQSPQYVCSLAGAFIEKVSEPELDWSKPGQPLVWTVTVRYSALVHANLVV